jgi:hypothetical protein
VDQEQPAVRAKEAYEKALQIAQENMPVHNPSLKDCYFFVWLIHDHSNGGEGLED